VDGLLGGAALAVDGRARDVLREAGHEPAGAGDVAGLRTDAVDVAEHHVVDGGGVDARPLDEGPDRVGPEIGGVHLREATAPAPDGGADRFDDVGLGHLGLLFEGRLRFAVPLSGHGCAASPSW